MPTYKNYLQAHFEFLAPTTIYWVIVLLASIFLLLLFKQRYHISQGNIVQQFFNVRKIERNFPQKSSFYWSSLLVFTANFSFASYFLLLYFFTHFHSSAYYFYLSNFFTIWWVFALIYGTLLFLRYTFLYVALLIFNQQNWVSKIVKMEILSCVSAAFILVFLNLTFYLSGANFKWIFFIFGVILLLFTMVVMHWIRLFKFSRLHSVPILYIFSYICTLEILPLLILVKYFLGFNVLEVFKL